MGVKTLELQQLYSRVRRCVEEYNMIEEGDRIAVGVSGGKDSMCALAGLAGLARFYPKKFSVVAITLDLGYGTDYSPIREYCNSLGVEYNVVETQIKQIVFDIRKEENPCALCAKMRRGALNDAAKDRGLNKLALGHHREDVIETLLLSLIYEGRLHTFHPNTYLSRSGITVIRPMVYLPEKHVIHVSKELDLPVVKSACKADGNTKREEMKELLKNLTKTYPNIKEYMLKALQNKQQYGLWDQKLTGLENVSFQNKSAITSTFWGARNEELKKCVDIVERYVEYNNPNVKSKELARLKME